MGCGNLFFTELFNKSRKKSLKNWNKLHVKKEHQQSLMNCYIWTTGHSNVAPPLTKKNDHSLAFYFPCHVFFLFLYFSWVEVFPFVTIKWLLFTNLFILKRYLKFHKLIFLWNLQFRFHFSCWPMRLTCLAYWRYE